MSTTFKLKFTMDGEAVTFEFKQLDFETRTAIAAVTTKIEGGELIIDVPKVGFLNLKNGLVNVEGLQCPDGTEYIAIRDPDGTMSDQTLNELLNTPLCDNILYASQNLSVGLPKEILHPITGKPLEGVELIFETEKGGIVKKP